MAELHAGTRMVRLFDDRSVRGLSGEMQEKLIKVQPHNARPSLTHSRSDPRRCPW